LSGFLPIDNFEDINNVNFRLDINGKTVQQGSSSLMIFPVARQIAHISQYITFKTGDLLFTGTPAGVGPVAKGDRLEAYLEDRKMLDFQVK
jgi:2-keto-4-pentenoate hydratase/2-oxohepta-3-ene-1,7-dioic acid hydratase in catechol pathway